MCERQFGQFSSPNLSMALRMTMPIRSHESVETAIDVREGAITGRATEIEVASKATARVIMQRLMNEA